MIIEWLALFAILPSRIVLAIVADSAGHSARSLVDHFVEVTRIGMIVAIARSTSVRLFADSGLPRQIVVEVFATLTIETFSIVCTLTSAMDHVLFIRDSW